MQAAELPKLADCAVVPLDLWKTKSGLEVLRELVAGRLPPPPMAGLIGFNLIEVDEGVAVFAGTPGFQHYNPAGAVHGGYAAALLDSCMTCSIQTTLPAGTGVTTLEYKINLVRAMTKDTGPVRAEGKMIHPGKRTATAEGRIIDSQGRLLAHGTTTCFVFPL
ncbi:MAG TPA: PaaI family thioesterase [Magnetospirillaceae bacterium]|jgi:uncharacterized protein (TIGR00369 family)